VIGRAALALVVVLAGACAVQPPRATAADAARGQVELAELDAGRSLLVSKCSGACHRAPLPSQHTAGEWPGKLDEMSARAGIDRHQRALIEKYLVVMATRR
jgi:hypothetical protein